MMTSFILLISGIFINLFSSVDFRAYLTLGIALIDFLLAIFIYLRNPQRKQNRYFSLFICLVGAWVLLSFFLDNQIFGQERSLMFFARAVLVPPIFIPYVFLLAVKSFGHDPFPRNQKILFFIPVLILLVLSPTSANIERIIFDSSPTNYEAGWLYIPFTVYFIFYFIFALWIIYKVKKKYRGYKSWQANIIFWVVCIAASLCILYNSIFLLAGYRLSLNIGPIISSLVSYGITYAIFRYHFIGVLFPASGIKLGRKITWKDLPPKYSYENLAQIIQKYIQDLQCEEMRFYARDQAYYDKTKTLFFEPLSRETMKIHKDVLELIENDSENVFERLDPERAFFGIFNNAQEQENSTKEINLLCLKFEKEILGFILFRCKSSLSTESKAKLLSFSKQLYIILNNLWRYQRTLSH